MPVRDPSTTSNGVTFLIVFLILSVILSFLFILKFLFRRSRTLWFSKLAVFPSASFPGPPGRLLSKVVKYQSPFLVGFLGSPTRETRITISVHEVMYEQQRSFFTAESPQFAKHRRFKPSEAIYSSPSLHSLTSGPYGRLLSTPSGQAADPFSMSGRQGMFFYAPTPPPPAVCESSRAPLRRRYSLPPTARSNVQLTQIRRSCSTKARRAKYKGSDVESIFFSPRPTSKVPENAGDHSSLMTSPSLCSRASESQTKVLTAAEQDASMLPVLLQDTAVESAGGEDNTSNGIQQYVLASDPVASPTINKADCQSPLQSYQARNTFTPLTLDTPESTMNLDTLNETLLPLSPVTMFKLRPRTRIQSNRPRRSPRAGPSPLRTMILPDISDPDLTPLFKAPIEDVTANPTSFSTEHTLTSRLGSAAVEENDTDPLLGLIRELVEEVNDWDDSLFMDNNFKNMIENSQDISCVKIQPGPPASETPSDDETKHILQPRHLNSNDFSVLSGGGHLISYWSDDCENTDNIGIAQ